MSDPHTHAGEPLNGPSNPAPSGPAMSPGAARRRLAVELRTLRLATRQSLKDVGNAIERSEATISRFESAKLAQYYPRMLEVIALLEHFRNVSEQDVTNEVRERILFLAGESRKEQWFEPFKNGVTGDILPSHLLNFVGYETDANEIRTYEPNLIPGLLQTRAYAQMVAELFFPNRTPVEHGQFVEFRIARQAKLRERGDDLRLSFVVNEVALRRVTGGDDVVAEQLDALAAHITDPADTIDLRIVPLSVAQPAALRGPFVIMSFPPDSTHSPDSTQQDVVYLETGSGGDYLVDPDSVARFYGYYENLLAAALSPEDAVRLIESMRPDTNRDRE